VFKDNDNSAFLCFLFDDVTTSPLQILQCIQLDWMMQVLTWAHHLKFGSFC